MNICKIKNLTGEITPLYEHEFQIDEIFEITEDKRIAWANNDSVLTAISNANFEIHDSSGAISGINNQINYLKDNLAQEIYGEITPLVIKNEHRMQPFGATKGCFLASDYGCSITLSNKSQNGLIFNYNSNIPIVPSIGNYIFQDNFCQRTWITEVDTENYTITVELPVLENGTGNYRIGYYADCLIRDWYTTMYLWSCCFMAGYTNSHDGKNDFIEFSVIDKYDLFLTDNFCQAVFGVDADEVEPYLLAAGFEQNGEYEHWTLYYDESWVLNILNRNNITPDGAPGALIPLLYTRASYFSSKEDTTVTDFYCDYYFTGKDADFQY